MEQSEGLALSRTRRGLEQVIRTLTAHVGFGETIEFGVHEGREPRERLFIALSPRQQKFGEFVSRRFVHRRNSQDCSE